MPHHPLLQELVALSKSTFHCLQYPGYLCANPNLHESTHMYYVSGTKSFSLLLPLTTPPQAGVLSPFYE